MEVKVEWFGFAHCVRAAEFKHIQRVDQPGPRGASGAEVAGKVFVEVAFQVFEQAGPAIPV
jgi:hypothetical protein